MSKLIEPRTLRGFRDYPPELMIPRERSMETARRVFRSYGFGPIDTPALELTEILLAKVEAGSEINKQLYRFQDAGGRDVALRFDLTVPLARFVSQHFSTLGMPFKRYHLGTVWRGESPQAGRYREFMQCDFDTIGTLSNAADVEIALVIHDLLVALGFERFEIHVNNRLVLNGLLDSLGLSAQTAVLLRSLDKLAKIGRDGVRDEMIKEAGVSAEQALSVIALAETKGSNTEVLAQLAERFSDNESARKGVAHLEEMCRVLRTAGVPEERLHVDLSICRGLDYYTGTVYETFLNDLPGIGSICSGGRYDNLTGRYTKQALPGVGASLGLDRLLAAMEELKLLPKVGTPAPVLITLFAADRLGDYQRVARLLRVQNIGCEVYPDAKKLGAQFQYAEKRGFKVALIAGPDEFATGTWKVKDLAKREEIAVAEAELIETVRRLVEGN
ncbi:MAG: histidine--tRNA ligase [Planctomycetes bacterium]|nr:histidine--tRNA ligase [Planctomycetota bacterium]